MFHFTFCGGTEVRISEADNTIFTMWGATVIRLPTMAEKVRYVKGVLDQYGSLSDFNLRHTMVISFMGGTAVQTPTIAQEIEDMVQLKELGFLSADELNRLWKEVAAGSDIDLIEKISIFGGCGEDRPSKKEEIRDLERIAARGIISHEELDQMVGILNGRIDPQGRRNFLHEKLRSVFLPDASSELPSFQPPPLSKSHLTE